MQSEVCNRNISLNVNQSRHVLGHTLPSTHTPLMTAPSGGVRRGGPNGIAENLRPEVLMLRVSEGCTLTNDSVKIRKFSNSFGRDVRNGPKMLPNLSRQLIETLSVIQKINKGICDRIAGRLRSRRPAVSLHHEYKIQKKRCVADELIHSEFLLS